MKSTYHGNIPNMRGKPTHTFSCRCCMARDLRGQYDARMAEKEMRESAMAEEEWPAVHSATDEPT